MVDAAFPGWRPEQPDRTSAMSGGRFLVLRCGRAHSQTVPKEETGGSHGCPRNEIKREFAAVLTVVAVTRSPIENHTDVENAD